MSQVTQVHPPRGVARLGAALAGALLLAAALAMATPERSRASISLTTADLGVSLRASSSLLLTDTVDYSLTATNYGPYGLFGGTITVQFPTQVTTVSGGGCSFDPFTDRATCTVGQLVPSETANFVFRARYALSVGLALRTTATRTSSAPSDINPSNDSSTATCTVVAPVAILC